jgi:hypothetical protein
VGKVLMVLIFVFPVMEFEVTGVQGVEFDVGARLQDAVYHLLRRGQFLPPDHQA